MAKSIYQLICDHISGDVLDPAFSLPEEDSDPAALHFADGARDGIFVYHMAHSGLTAAQSREMGKALRAAAGDRYEEAEELMAAWTRECNVARSINQMHKYVLDYADRLDAGKMFHNARSFMLFSANIHHQTVLSKHPFQGGLTHLVFGLQQNFTIPMLQLMMKHSSTRFVAGLLLQSSTWDGKTS